MTTASFWGMSALLPDRAVPAPLIPLPFAFKRAGDVACHRTMTGAAHILRHRRF